MKTKNQIATMIYILKLIREYQVKEMEADIEYGYINQRMIDRIDYKIAALKWVIGSEKGVL